MATVLKILPRFQADLVGISPIVVTKSGLQYTIAFTTAAAEVSVVGVKQELVSRGVFDTILATIPGGPADAVNQAWTGGGKTQATGPLLTSIFTTLGYSAAQQAEFITAAQARAY